MDKRPTFTRVFDQPILGLQGIRWTAANPSVMFPTVLEAPAWVNNPLDRLYMYYASHHGEGIGLATAPVPEGPWRVYEGGPVFTLAQAPMLKGHVSSPDIMLAPEQEAVYLYYHGGGAHVRGQTMGSAHSRDGLSFEVTNPEVLLHPPEDEARWDGLSHGYLRSFRVGEELFGVYMGYNGGGIAGCTYNKQGLARSDGYLHWERVGKRALLEASEGSGDFGTIRHSGVLVRDGCFDAYYSTRTSERRDREVLKVARVATEGRPQAWQAERLGTVLEPELPWEGADLRDPFPFCWEGKLYLYYAGGLEAGIGLAVAEDC